MRQESTNTFTGGLQKDTFPLTTGTNVLTDTLNATLITYFGNEISLQNDLGNCRLIDEQGTIVTFTEGFYPIAVKEYSEVLYFILKNYNDNTVEIGTYPSPDYGLPIPNTNPAQYKLSNKYRPLFNLNDSDFRTSNLSVSTEYQVQMELQKSYDNSINIIWTDKVNTPRLINSGFYVTKDKNCIINQKKYDSATIGKDSLYTTFTNIPDVVFNGCSEGGSLPVGNYYFYFYYIDNDGNETNIVAHSSIVSCFKNSLDIVNENGERYVTPKNIMGGILNENSGKYISFLLTDIDDNYTNIKIKFSRSTCDYEGQTYIENYEIFSYYAINNRRCEILINNLDNATQISSQVINSINDTTSVPVSIAQIQNRLFEANLRSTSSDVYDKLRIYSQKIYPMTFEADIIGRFHNDDKFTIMENTIEKAKPISGYYDEKNIYYYTGYWEEEIYKLGIVYIVNGQETPVFSIRGCNSLSLVSDKNLSLFYTSYPDDTDLDNSTYINDDRFLLSNIPMLENIDGVVRMTNNGEGQWRRVVSGYDSVTTIYPVGISFYIPNSLINTFKDLNVSGFYFVRQKRDPLIVAQGIKLATDKLSGLPALITGEPTTRVKEENVVGLDYYYIDPNLKKGHFYSVIGSHLEQYWRSYSEYNYSTYGDSWERPYSYNWNIQTPITSGKSSERNNTLLAYHSTYDLIKAGYSTILDYTHNGTRFICSDVRDIYLKSDNTPDIKSERLNNILGNIIIAPDVILNPTYYSTIFATSDLKYVIRKSRINESITTLNNVRIGSGSKSFVNNLYYPYFKFGTMQSGLLFNFAFPTTNFIVDYNGIQLINNWHESMHNADADVLDTLGFIYVPEGTTKQTIGNGYNIATIAGNENNYDASLVFIEPQYLDKNYTGVSETALPRGMNYVTRGIFTSVLVSEFPISDNRVTQDNRYLSYDPYDLTESNLNHSYFNIYINGFSEKNIVNYFKKVMLKNDNYYSVSKRYSFDIMKRENDKTHTPSNVKPTYDNINGYEATDVNKGNYGKVTAFGGDCFVGLFANRMMRNFTSSTNPAGNKFVGDTVRFDLPKVYDQVCTDGILYSAWFQIYDYDSSKYMVTPADVDGLDLYNANTAFLGYWVIFPTISNYNICLRNNDYSDISKAFTQPKRSFLPNTYSLMSQDKVEDSKSYNFGYNTLPSQFIKYNMYTGLKNYFTQNNFNTRIQYSEIHATDEFINSYRQFKQMSYKDYSNTYGAITKIHEWRGNCMVIFESGVGLVTVNERVQMTEGQGGPVYLNSANVLSEIVYPLSETFGSTWSNGSCKTDMSVYGIDTRSKRIWRTDGRHFETISDFKIQKYLSETISTNLSEERPLEFLDKFGMNEIRNVNVYFNRFKGDVHFCIYYNQGEQLKDTVENPYSLHLIYNEKSQIWVTRCNWYPNSGISVDNKFFTVDQEDLGNNTKSLELWRHGYMGIDPTLEIVPDEHGNKQFAIMPTRWYNKQHEFQFEFVVSQPIGLHKVFSHLKFISNKVQPNQLKMEIVGEAYDFHKQKYPLYETGTAVEADTENISNYDINQSQPTKGYIVFNSPVDIVYDFHTNEQKMIITQDIHNMEDSQYGRRLGNAFYKEDSWNIQLDQILYTENGREKETLIRDKYIKIKVIYDGNDLAILSAIKTFFTLSYS